MAYEDIYYAYIILIFRREFCKPLLDITERLKKKNMKVVVPSRYGYRNDNLVLY